MILSECHPCSLRMINTYNVIHHCSGITVGAVRSSTAFSRSPRTPTPSLRTLPGNGKPVTARIRRSSATSAGSWARELSSRKTPVQKSEASEAGPSPVQIPASKTIISAFLSPNIIISGDLICCTHVVVIISSQWPVNVRTQLVSLGP